RFTLFPYTTLFRSVYECLVVWQYQRRKTAYQKGEAIYHQRHPQDAGKKARPVHQEPKRKQPKAPKYSGDIKSITVHIEERHSQCIALRLVKQGEGIGSTYEDEGGDGVQLS